MSIAKSLIDLAVDEGTQIALNDAEKFQLTLETIMEIGTPDERRFASHLLLVVNRTIEVLVEGTLIEVGREIGTDNPYFSDVVLERTCTK